MGTRSTTKVYENGKLILALYKQYDGYPNGWGKELLEFINSGIFVNGINESKLPRNKSYMFNGIGDFALQLVCHFKEGSGGMYATTEGDSQEYNYKIEYNNKPDGKAGVIVSCDEDENFYDKREVVLR
jgi:hypothetical protein